MPLIQTRGAASAQGFGEFAQAATAVNYIEDVFSTYLYTGTGAALTITNNIDLSTKGGLVWIKGRSGATGHRLTDTARGVTKSLESNSTAAEVTESTGLTAFGTTGFTIGADTDYNTSAATYASWTFRKQPKFFDIVTYSGNSVTQNVAHSLGSVPGSIFVKRTDGVGDWYVYHRSSPSSGYLKLNTTAAAVTATARFVFGDDTNPVAPTSTVFTVSGGGGVVNNTGETYIAYIFAHDAGGFGLTGTDNVISCGSFTTDGGGGATVNLGYEPQWILFKRSDSAVGGAWYIVDTMRNWSFSAVASLSPNTSAAEDTAAFIANPTATGFSFGTGTLVSSAPYIYIAIRRGPMKVPTLGTSVFSPITFTGSSASRLITGTNFPVDLLMGGQRTGTTNPAVVDRLRGAPQAFITPTTSAETTSNGTTQDVIGFDYMDGYKQGSPYNLNINSNTALNVLWFFRRAPSFMDVVCGNTSAFIFSGTHNLTVVPEMIITKDRTSGSNWAVYHSALGVTKYLYLNATNGAGNASPNWIVTSTTFTDIGTSAGLTDAMVAYLFATCAGVSKVGSYTGTGTTKQIDCGFTAGARFVLIKRTDSTGDWYVWDTARGIIAGNDPYLLLNSAAAEVTSTDYIDTYSAGFEISSTAPAAINASAGTFIFLAIA